SDRRAHTRTNFQGRNRRSVRGCDWFRYANHRASSRGQWRHARDAASRLGHEHLARDARGGDHHWVRGDVSRWDASDDLHRARRVHAVTEKTNGGFACAHDLWGGLLCHVVQFCGHSPRRNLGRSIVGPFLGLGSERKWRGADRSLVRNYFACALGRVYPATRSDDHGDLRERGHQFLMVWREHARRWPAFLRFHAKSFPLAGWVHAESGCVDGDRRDATRALAKLQHGKCSVSRAPANLTGTVHWLNVTSAIERR